MKPFILLAMFLPVIAMAQDETASGVYKICLDQPKQIILGLGVEIQNDSIGSGNSGMPEEVVAIPHDLVAAERQRFYKELLKGFRYCRLAMGLYFRGLDADRKHVVERYPNQLRDLRELIQESGMEGVSMEYWSCAPAWKSTDSYLGGTIKSTDPDFLDQFAEALVTDIKYLQNNGIPISMWGLQNEPSVKTVGDLKIGKAPPQSYSHCTYSPEAYVATFKAVAPKVRQALGKGQIIVDSMEGNSGEIGTLIQRDPELLQYVDAWVYHRIGANSNQMINETELYRNHTFGKPVFQNEFEYQEKTSAAKCLNTAQHLMNWMVFADSPTCFWLHVLKPTANAEASGYSLGFWRPEGDNDLSHLGHINKGAWDYNDYNYNALAGFLKYMPWDSRRYEVQEDEIRNDNRILAFKTPDGKLVIVVTNRSGHPFSFKIETGSKNMFKGFRYTPGERNVPLGVSNGQSLAPILPDLSIEFWIEQ